MFLCKSYDEAVWALSFMPSGRVPPRLLGRLQRLPFYVTDRYHLRNALWWEREVI